MLVSFSDPIYLTAIYFAVLSILLLLRFTSLIFEVEQGLQLTSNIKDSEAQAIVWATANINLIVLFAAFLLIVWFCVQLSQLGQYWHQYFMLAAAAAVLYWRYTWACEQKLKSFLHRVAQEVKDSPPKTIGE